MQEIANYGDLKSAVRSWLNRKDQATLERIPVFINFAEKQFTRLVRLPFYETEVRRTIENDNLLIEIPNDFLSLKHLVVNGLHLTRTDVETFKRLEARGGAGTRPYYFTRIGSKIITYPSMKNGDQVSFIYNKDIPEMREEADSPYSLIIAPDVLLYLSLRHASIFLRDNEQEQYWAQKAQDAAAEVNAQLDEAEWKGSSLVVPVFDESETNFVDKGSTVIPFFG